MIQFDNLKISYRYGLVAVLILLIGSCASPTIDPLTTSTVNQSKSPAYETTPPLLASETPTYIPPPTPTFTSIPALTEASFGEPNIQTAISQLGLDPAKIYSIEGDYLVDTHNLAKMAKWANDGWIESTLEEKYGHLVNPVYQYPVVTGYGNIFFDENGDTDGTDRRYENVHICANSTGNMWKVREAIPGLIEETDVVYGDFVFRDKQGDLQLLNVRVDVVDPAEAEHTVYVSVPSGDGQCFANGGIFARADSADEIADFYHPGMLVSIDYAYLRPDQMPLPAHRFFHPQWKLSNFRNRANYLFWIEHRSQLRNLAEQLLSGNFDGDQDIAIPAQFVRPLLPLDEALKLEMVSWYQ